MASTLGSPSSDGQNGKGKKSVMYPPEYQPSGEVFEKMAEKKVKFILVMLPPPEGHPLSDVVRKALECDYDQISHLGRKLKNILQDSESVDIKTEYGTRLHFSLKNRPILVEDGVLSEEDMKEDFILLHLPQELFVHIQWKTQFTEQRS